MDDFTIPEEKITISASPFETEKRLAARNKPPPERAIVPAHLAASLAHRLALVPEVASLRRLPTVEHRRSRAEQQAEKRGAGMPGARDEDDPLVCALGPKVAGVGRRRVHDGVVVRRWMTAQDSRRRGGTICRTKREGATANPS